MGFFKGFLDQWNIEDDRKDRAKERSDSMRIAMAQHLGKRREMTAKQRDEVEKGAQAILWIDNKLGDFENKEEYLDQLQSPEGYKTAIAIKDAYGDFQKNAYEKEGRAVDLSPEEFITTFQVIVATPELQGAAGSEEKYRELMELIADGSKQVTTDNLIDAITLPDADAYGPTVALNINPTALASGSTSGYSTQEKILQNFALSKAGEIRKNLDFDLKDPNLTEEQRKQTGDELALIGSLSEAVKEGNVYRMDDLLQRYQMLNPDRDILSELDQTMQRHKFSNWRTNPVFEQLSVLQ